MAGDNRNEDKALLASVRACTACKGLPLGPRPILQWGPAAPILIAGQAPGRRTHERGIPFDDPSGERLREWLGVGSEVFYDPMRFAILPMAFCFPGAGKNGDLPPRPECASLWRNQLLRRLETVRLTIILGRYAAQWHLGTSGGALTAEVARWRETLPRVVVLPHPSPRNRNWIARNPWFEKELLPDLRRRVREALRKS
ncbi:MAG: uracil-DNA glycosylase family protein [Sphingomonadales bacterium]|nr:uracil-DNA glycosylase family protein [Sphingomonadales bacterium]